MHVDIQCLLGDEGAQTLFNSTSFRALVRQLPSAAGVTEGCQAALLVGFSRRPGARKLELEKKGDSSILQ